MAASSWRRAISDHAYGTPHADSDVDILVIMPARNQLDQAVRIEEDCDPPFPLDIIVRTPKNLQWRYAHERRTNSDRKTLLQTKTMAAIEAEMHSFEKSPRYEWLGDLQQIAAQCSVQ